MKKGKSLIAIVVVTAVIITAGISVYAEEEVGFTERVFGIGRFMHTEGEGIGHMSGMMYNGFMGGQRGNSEALLEEAVEEGIITEDELNEVIEHMEENRPDIESLSEVLEGLTKEEAREYMIELHGERSEPYEKIVEEGILTQEQADEIVALRLEEFDENFCGRGSRSGMRQGRNR